MVLAALRVKQRNAIGMSSPLVTWLGAELLHKVAWISVVWIWYQGAKIFQFVPRNRRGGSMPESHYREGKAEPQD